jgi:calcium permeable stress-gated cation channel
MVPNLFLVIVWIWWNIKHEMVHYVDVRQQYLVSPAHSSTAQARSVLVTGIPPKYLTESALTRLFDHLPGGVRKVWINRDLKDIPDLYERRLKACDMLESAGTSLLSTAVKCNHEKQKKAGNKDGSSAGDPEASRKALMEELVPRKDRPTHRLPPFSWFPFSLPFMGKKVDTMEWARDQVQELNTQLEERREILARDIARTTAAEVETTVHTHHIGAGKLSIALPSLPVSIPLIGAVPAVDFSDQTYPPVNGAFILFNKQIAAHIAAQILTHHEPYCMSASLKFIEVAPDDVIWENLVMNPYERRVRSTISWAATIGLIILWAIPGQSYRI